METTHNTCTTIATHSAIRWSHWTELYTTVHIALAIELYIAITSYIAIASSVEHTYALAIELYIAITSYIAIASSVEHTYALAIELYIAITSYIAIASSVEHTYALAIELYIAITSYIAIASSVEHTYCMCMLEFPWQHCNMLCMISHGFAQLHTGYLSPSLSSLSSLSHSLPCLLQSSEFSLSPFSSLEITPSTVICDSILAYYTCVHSIQIHICQVIGIMIHYCIYGTDSFKMGQMALKWARWL